MSRLAQRILAGVQVSIHPNIPSRIGPHRDAGYGRALTGNYRNDLACHHHRPDGCAGQAMPAPFRAWAHLGLCLHAQALVNQLMQVPQVGLTGLDPILDAAAVHGEHRFPDWIDPHQHQGPCGHAWVSLKEHHPALRQPEAGEIGATVAQEDAPERVVQQQEADHGRDAPEAQLHDQHVTMQPGQRCQAGQHDGYRSGRQAIQAVNDVDGVRDTANGKNGEQHGQLGVLDQRIKTNGVQIRESDVQHPDGQGSRGKRRQKPRAHANLLGQVFCEPGEENGCGTCKQQQRGRVGLAAVEVAGDDGDEQSESQPQPAYTGHRFGVDFLNAGQIMVKGMPAMPALRQHKQGAHP